MFGVSSHDFSGKGQVLLKKCCKLALRYMNFIVTETNFTVVLMLVRNLSVSEMKL